MKLSVKTNLILLPVMIVIFSVAGMFSYYSQKEQILLSLTERVKYELEYISNDLNEDIYELDILSDMFLGSRYVQRYLTGVHSEGDGYFLKKEFIPHIKQLNLRHASIESFTLLNANGDPVLFHDFNDPFAKFQQTESVTEHLSYIGEAIRNQGVSHIHPTSFEYRQTEHGDGEFVLIKTFSPDQSIMDTSFSVGHSIYTAVVIQQIKHEHGFLSKLQSVIDDSVQLTISSRGSARQLIEQPIIELLPDSTPGYGFQLTDKLWDIRISLPDSYLNRLYQPQRDFFIIVVLAVTLVTFILLKSLITQQIIRPVLRLTKQVEDADIEEVASIKRPIIKDEVSLLTNKYLDLIAEFDDMSKRDRLTGLPNRDRFVVNLRRIIDQSIKYNKKSAVLYFDLDNFKSVNDKYGHHVGDNLLKKFAEELVEGFVDFDWDNIEVDEFEFARLAGDEFAMVVSGIKELDVVVLFANQIISLFEDGYELDGHLFDVGVSIGISVCPDDAVTVDDIVKNADAAMYSAKKERLNSFHFYSNELDSKIKRHEMISASLRKALDRDEFHLVYMPIYNCKDGSLGGAEALLRAGSDELLSYGPAEFIPVAEISGIIKDIDYWVIDSALRQLSQWIKEFNFDGVLAINFSSWQLKNPEFVEVVASLIEFYNVPAQSIELEITETCFVPGQRKNIEMLAALHELGVKISLDDFGTGFTAFSQLIDYPVDTLKVDKMFIDAIDADEGSNTRLVDIIVEMAKLYDLNVIAEGVETEQQLEHILELGCQQVQGFLFSKPLPEEAFTSLWKEQDSLRLTNRSC